MLETLMILGILGLLFIRLRVHISITRRKRKQSQDRNNIY